MQIQVYPVVSSVSGITGSLGGGHVLTITGLGFSTSNSANKVRVEGMPCQVLSATSTELTCRTAMWNSTVDGFTFFQGGHGVRWAEYPQYYGRYGNTCAITPLFTLKKYRNCNHHLCYSFLRFEFYLHFFFLAILICFAFFFLCSLHKKTYFLICFPLLCLPVMPINYAFLLLLLFDHT